tara:strand:+ start:202 stop:480 length:279 start_codon:yes stop_codon:yes gene_type:complete
MNSKEKKVIQKIFAITSQCLLQGNLPTDEKQLMKLFQPVDATKDEIIQLAKENKLEWLSAYGDPNSQNKEEYNKRMSVSLATYLSGERVSMA